MFNDKNLELLSMECCGYAMAGFQISDAMYIGYGYDLETTNLNNYNSGSHEIFLRYELFKE
jgi:hypothetical protein